MSSGISGGKEKIKFADGGMREIAFAILSKRNDDLIAMQNARFDSRQN